MSTSAAYHLIEGLAQAVLAIRLPTFAVMLLGHFDARFAQPIAGLQVCRRKLGATPPSVEPLPRGGPGDKAPCLPRSLPLDEAPLGDAGLRRAFEIDRRPVEDRGVLVAGIDGDNLARQVVGGLVLAVPVEIEGVLIDILERLSS